MNMGIWTGISKVRTDDTVRTPVGKAGAAALAGALALVAGAAIASDQPGAVLELGAAGAHEAVL